MRLWPIFLRNGKDDCHALTFDFGRLRRYNESLLLVLLMAYQRIPIVRGHGRHGNFLNARARTFVVVAGRVPRTDWPTVGDSINQKTRALVRRTFGEIVCCNTRRKRGRGKWRSRKNKKKLYNEHWESVGLLCLSPGGEEVRQRRRRHPRGPHTVPPPPAVKCLLFIGPTLTVRGVGRRVWLYARPRANIINTYGRESQTLGH